jgi:hypothetical protein
MPDDSPTPVPVTDVGDLLRQALPGDPLDVKTLLVRELSGEGGQS